MSAKPKPIRKMKAGTDLEQAEPSVSPGYDAATSPFSEVDDGGTQQALDGQDVRIARPTEAEPVVATKPPVPATYKEAAAVIRADKGLYAKYKAGVASGKAFSLSIGGKKFAYAATPKKQPAPKLPAVASDAAAQGWQDAFGADIASAKKAGQTAKQELLALKGPYTQATTQALKKMQQTMPQRNERQEGEMGVTDDMRSTKSAAVKKTKMQAAEQLPTPDSTEDNAAIAMANRRKMKR